MSLSKKTNMMDGYAVVRSLAQAREAAAKTASGPPPPVHSPVSPPAQGDGAPNPHIVKTIRPSQHTVRCFECGYEFKISGTTRTIYCAKCRAKIDMGDYIIDSPWSGEISTGGTVHITPSGRLENAHVRAGNIILEGGIDSSSTLECTQWLELASGGTLSPRQFTARNLRIAAGHAVRFPHKLLVNHLELYGELEGDIEATGLVDIRAGGHLKGILRSAHLQVEDGGGLSARAFIWPQDSST